MTTVATMKPQPRKKREQMSFTEVLKFNAWMNAERLTGYYVRKDFMTHASTQLGFTVKDRVLDAWLEENGVEMPTRPGTKTRATPQQVSDDIAAIALALMPLVTPESAAAVMLTRILERRTEPPRTPRLL